MSNEIKKDAIESAGKQNLAKQGTLSMVKGLLNNEEVKKRFSEIISDPENVKQFTASILSLISSSTNFNDVDPNTIISSALVAATLRLPINQNFGFAYIIPFNSKTGKKAQFMMGYKGFLQLALRSGQYRTINAVEIYEGELTERNKLTGVIKIDESQKKSNKIVGYAAYFELISGFSKTLFMTVDEISAHAKKYSKSYDNKEGLWKKDFHAMALKTVLKTIISKTGVLSVDYNMQKAVEADQSVINDDGSFDYVDSNDGEIPADVEKVPTEFSPEDWENVSKVVGKLETLTGDDLESFLVKNEQRLSSFGGKDAELVSAVIKNQKK